MYVYICVCVCECVSLFLSFSYLSHEYNINSFLKDIVVI